MMDNKKLSQQVLYQINRYDKLAKRNQRTCLNTTLLKRKMHLTTAQWGELKAGSNHISYNTYQEALGLIKQSYYQLAQIIQNHVHVTIAHGHHNLSNFTNIKSHKHPNKKGVITSITPQKHTASRFNVFINYKYAFPVGANVIAKFYLHNGMKISPKLQKKIVQSDVFDKSMTKIIPYVTKSLHSESAVIKKLKKFHTTKVNRIKIIKRLKQLNLINDLEYAKLFVKDQIQLSNHGPQRIKEKLYQHKINPEYINQALSEYTNNTELVHAQKLVKMLFNQYIYYSFSKSLRKIRMNLMRKGYANSIISKAILNCRLKPNHEHEMELLKDKLHLANIKYGHYKSKNKFKYNMKVRQYLYRQGFSSDDINSIL